MSYIEDLIKECLSAAAVAGVLAFFGKSVVEHWLKEHADKNLAVLRAQLTEDTTIRTTMLKDQLDTNSTILRAQLTEDTTIRVEARKSELSQDVQMALEVARWRQPAYVALWSMMEIVSIGRSVELTPDIRRQLADDLTGFYFKDGHALYLSAASTSLFLAARDLVRSQADVSDDQIREAFSELRTQMKIDLSVYTPEQLVWGRSNEIRVEERLEPQADQA